MTKMLFGGDGSLRSGGGVKDTALQTKSVGGPTNLSGALSPTWRLAIQMQNGKQTGVIRALGACAAESPAGGRISGMATPLSRIDTGDRQPPSRRRVTAPGSQVDLESFAEDAARGWENGLLVLCCFVAPDRFGARLPGHWRDVGTCRFTSTVVF